MHTIKTEDEAVGGRGAGLDEGIRTKCIDMYRECQVKPILFLDSIQAKALIKISELDVCENAVIKSTIV